MRVIAGEKRSIKLNSVEGENTRPTTDRIKETLFNIINERLYNASFLDLYAGSGQIGIEALSRGAKISTFIEKDRKACDVIEKNLIKTGLLNRAEIIKRDVSASLLTLKNGPFDIIFMDPPYKLLEEKEILLKIDEAKLLKKDGIIIIEASKEREKKDIIDEDTAFTLKREKIYKTNKHLFIGY